MFCRDQQRSSSVPQKVHPAVFDDRGVQLQGEEVVVQDSERTARVDVQQNQRPLHEARTPPAVCVPLVGSETGRGVGGREHRLHSQSSQRCEPPGPREGARGAPGHHGLERWGIRLQVGGINFQRDHRCLLIDLDLSSCLVVSPIFGSPTPHPPPPLPFPARRAAYKSARPKTASPVVRARVWEEEEEETALPLQGSLGYGWSRSI